MLRKTQPPTTRPLAFAASFSSPLRRKGHGWSIRAGSDDGVALSMAIDLLIHYRDASREVGYFPFAFQRYARLYWWPIAERLGLEKLQQLELLTVRTEVEVDELIEEIRRVRDYVSASQPEEIPPDHRTYLLERIDKVIPFLQQARAEWSAIDHLNV
jgi:hypothetical protein